MTTSESRHREPASSRSLREAIRQARIKEALNIDEVSDRRSSELARLEVLKAALEKVFDEIPQGDDRFELALVPSFPARLWVDMFTYVVMDPASHVYRLVRNGRQGRRVLSETRDVGEMAEGVLDYVAQQIVARERQLDGIEELGRRVPAAEAPAPPPASRAGVAVGAFLIGLLTGVLGLAAFLITS